MKALVVVLILAHLGVLWMMLRYHGIARELAREEMGKRAARAEIILGQCHDLLCDMVESTAIAQRDTVLDNGQEEWALQIITNILEHKNPHLCRKKPPQLNR